jgi:HK97 gp10 family phage protein
MSGFNITQWHGKKVFTLATAANVKAMKAAAEFVERDVKKNFTLSGTGRAYKRGKKVHRASLPGEPPAIDIGNLRASIMSQVNVTGPVVTGQVGPDIDYLAANTEVGTDVNYGLYLELGTSRMQPRPFLRPALKRTRRAVNKIFRKANS